MNYATLIAQIQNYANRTDAYFLAQIPNFIDQAMNRIYGEAKNIGFEVTVTDATLFAVGNPFKDKPANWRETISIQHTTNDAVPSTVFLLPRSYEFCQSYWPNRALQGAPVFYSEYSYNRFYFAPTPSYAAAGQMIYLALPLFNAENPTNFLTQRYPSLLLYACLLETASFLKDDERIPVFESLYNRALQNINRDTKERIIDRTSKRDKD